MKKSIPVLSVLKKVTPFTTIWICVFLVSVVATFFVRYAPQIQESYQIKKQENLFKEYWEREGKEKFKAVGLEPTEKIYQEELNEYLQSFLEKNPTVIPEKRVEELKVKFREWWETSGSYSFVVKNITPTEALYKKEEAKYIKAYTDKQLVYRLTLNPKDLEISQVFFHWLLAPNFIILLLEFIIGLFIAKRVENRFGALISTGFLFITFFISALFLVLFAGTSFFSRTETSYTGLSIGLALLLGIYCVQNVREKLERKNFVFAFSSLILLSGFIWFMCSGIYVAAILLSFGFFALGILLSSKLPALKRKQKVVLASSAKPKENPIEVRKKQTRKDLDEGLSCAMRGDFALAGKYLSDAMHYLLLENPLDYPLVLDTVKKIVSPTLYIDISSIQWLEWGVSTYQKNAYEASLLLLEKALLTEKDKKLARKALYLIGDIRIRENLTPEEGVKRLKKVIEMDASDILAKQAEKLIQNRKS